MLVLIVLWLQILVVLVLCPLILVVIVPITMKVIRNSFYYVSSNYFIAANIVYGAKCGCNFLKDVNINSNFLTAIHQKCF